jgi:hypothetical protein
MKQDNVFYVGVDVSKAKHAIAIAEGGRDGEVRYFGEIEATPAAAKRFVRKLQGKHPRLHFCLYEEGQGGTGVSGQHFHVSRLSLRNPWSEPDGMTRLVYPSQIQLIYGRLTTAVPTSRLRRIRAQEDETILRKRHFKPSRNSVRPPRSARTDQVLEDGRIRWEWRIRRPS